MHNWGKNIIGILLFLTVYFLNCTNPFNTRKAEQPDIGQTPNLTLQLDPDSLVKKMELAYVNKNKEFYADLFLNDPLADTSQFEFIPKYVNDQLSDWNYEKEINYFNNLISTNGLRSISLEMTRVEEWLFMPESTDRQQAYYNYFIQLQFDSYSKNYSGKSLFSIVKNQYYYIFSWDDRYSSSDSTWSLLKSEYLN